MHDQQESGAGFPLHPDRKRSNDSKTYLSYTMSLQIAKGCPRANGKKTRPRVAGLRRSRAKTALNATDMDKGLLTQRGLGANAAPTEIQRP
jgi:hypothetical protein